MVVGQAPTVVQSAVAIGSFHSLMDSMSHCLRTPTTKRSYESATAAVGGKKPASKLEKRTLNLPTLLRKLSPCVLSNSA